MKKYLLERRDGDRVEQVEMPVEYAIADPARFDRLLAAGYEVVDPEARAAANKPVIIGKYRRIETDKPKGEPMPLDVELPDGEDEDE